MTGAFIYCRLSKEGGRSVERQERLGRKIAADRGWDVAEVFKEWVSASQFSKKARKEWDRLIATIEALESGRGYAVILWMEDRSARHVLLAYDFVKVCKQVGLHRIVLPSMDYDFGDPEDEAKFMGEVVMAQREVAKMRKRVLAARLEEAEEGARHGGGTREFGSRGRRRVKDADGNQRTEFIVSEAQAAREQALIREAADRILAGDSLRAIRLDWTERGVTTPSTEARARKGQPPAGFSNQMLRKLLLSPRVAGYRTHNGMLHPSDDYQVILEPAKWEAVKAVLTDPARTTNHRGGLPRHELSGLLFCGLCRHRLYSQPRAGKLLYRCVNPRCSKVSRLAEPVERLVEATLFEAVESPAWDEQAAELPADDPTRPHHERLAELTAELDVLDRRIGEAELAEELGRQPHPSAATLRRMLADREAERDQHQAAVLRLQRGRTVAAVPRNLRAVWSGLSLDRRRNILKAVLKLPPEGKGIVIGPQGSGRNFDPDAIDPDWRG
jgi:site-specific DNA recombinase